MKKLASFALAAGLAVPGWAIAAPAEGWARTELADAAVKAYRGKFEVPAMSVAVITHGQIVYEKGWGIGDPAHAVVAGPDTAYRLASMSKSLTAVLAEDLIRQNKISLGVKARTLLPSLPAFHTESFEQLLSHLGGVRH